MEEASVSSGLVGGAWGYIPRLNRTPNFLSNFSATTVSGVPPRDLKKLHLPLPRFFFLLSLLWISMGFFFLF